MVVFSKRTLKLNARATSQAFVQALEPIKDSLYRHAQRSVWSKEQVPDVLQEAVMTAWREFGRFEKGTNFRAWMFQILVNTIFRFNKQNLRRREVSLEEPALEAMAAMDREEAWSQLLDRPDRLRQMLDERLARSLDRLGHVERQCFLLRLIEGFGYREIAAALNIPMGTAMSHVHRARMRMREDLAALAVERRIVKETVG